MISEPLVPLACLASFQQPASPVVTSSVPTFARKRIWLPPILLLLAYLLLAAFTAGDYGLSWDEPTRWRSGDFKLDYYARLFAAEDKAEVLRTAPKDLYPGLYDIPLALLRRHTSIDPIVLSRTFNVLFGALALAGTFALARLLVSVRTKDEDATPYATLTPYVAVGVLLACPEFYGHLFINPKDIPFAATYVWGLYGLGRFIAAFPRPSFARFALCGVTAGLCMATRPPGIALLGYAGLAALCWVLFFAARQERVSLTLRFALGGALMGLVAVATLIPWWPASHRNPFASSVGAVQTLRTFSQAIPVLFDGTVYNAGTTPWYYVVWMFLIKTPLWLTALLATGLALGLGRIIAKLLPPAPQTPQAKLIGWLIAFAAFFPVAYVLVKQPAIHNGFRHMLYILPPLAVLAAGVWASGMAWLETRGSPWIGWLATGAAAVSSLIVLVSLHPYQYIYYNSLVGGTEGALNRYETEYWFTSGKEAIELLIETPEYAAAKQRGEVRLMVSGPWQIIEPYLPEGVRLVGDAAESDFFLGNTQMRADTLVEGREIARIQRLGLPIVIIKSE